MSAHKIVGGRSDSGKTTLIREVLLPRAATVGPVVIADTMGYDYKGKARLVENPRHIPEVVNTQGFTRVRAVPTFSSSQSDEAGDALDEIVRYADALLADHEYVTLIVDEAHNFQISNHCYSRLLDRAMREWRGLGGSVIQATQDPVDLAKVTLLNSPDAFMFGVDRLPEQLSRRLQDGDPSPIGLEQYRWVHITNDYRPNRLQGPLPPSIAT